MTDVCAGCSVRAPWEHRCCDEAACPCSDCISSRLFLLGARGANADLKHQDRAEWESLRARLNAIDQAMKEGG